MLIAGGNQPHRPESMPAPGFSGTQIVLDHPHGLPGLIRQVSEASPQWTAWLDAERSISYRELELFSDELADRIRRLELPPGPVVLHIPRAVDVVVAMLGVLKSGRPYLPVALTEPDARIAAMVAAAAPVAVITPAAAAGTALAGLPALSVPRAVPDATTRPRPLEPVAADQPVYVMFTSGSTGAPKGVVLGSAALCNRLTWMRRTYRLGPADRILQKTQYTFDVSGWEFFWPLITGATGVSAPEGAHRDPAAIAGLIAEHSISVCHFVPSMLAEFVALPSVSELRSLRLVFTSGEALPTALARRTLALLPAELHNLYGPTEAAIDVTAWPVPRDLAPDQPVLIGTPIDNTTLHVVDGAGRPVPPGTPGELWIAGIPVAQGYAGRPELTEAAFPIAFGQRCYRTGDLVRWTGDGMAYLGRIDDQLKVDGVRIEPTEIEHVLTRSPEVAQAGVVAVRAPDGTPRLIAAIVGTSGRTPDEAVLRTQVAARLPTAFAPRGYLPMDHLPLNANGKLDRRRLRDLAQEWWDDRTVPDAADRLRAAWAVAVGAGADELAEDIGFLAAGGGSLAAVRFVATVRELAGVEMPLRLLLDEDRSLAEVRAFVATAPSTPVSSPGTPAPAARDVTPLTPEQARLWLISRLHPDSPAYNVVSVSRLTGELDRAALTSALDAVVLRHDMLRARVAEEDSPAGPALRYAATARFPIRWNTTDDPLTDEVINAFAAAAATTVVSDRQAPMAHAHLLSSTAEPSCCLVLVVNHLAADQRAMEVLLADIAAEYSAATAGRPARLAPAPSHAEHAAHAVARVGDPAWNADLGFWRDRLAGAPPELLLPFRLADGPPDFHGVATSVVLDLEFHAELRDYLRARRATLASFFLAVFATVLTGWSGQDSVVVGVPASRRRRVRDDDLVGFLVDTLPVRLDVAGCADFAGLLAHARKRYVEALDHATPSFDHVVRALNPAVRTHRNPVFQVWLNDLTAGAAAPDFAGLSVTELVPPVAGALFELGLYLHRTGDTVTVRLVHATGVVPAEVAAELLAQISTVARHVVAGRPAGLVTERAAALLPALDHPPGPAGPRVDVLRDLAATAAVRLDEPAVDRRTHRQLWAEVRRCAERLLACGVRPGDVVEVLATRSADLPVALLASWQVGAAAGLVDAALPPARISACRETLGASARLTMTDGLRVTASHKSTVDKSGDPARSHVLFTSGTAGEPAGVAVQHGPLRDFLRWYTAEFGLTAADRFALVSGVAHDPMLRDVLTPLWLGARLEVPPDETFADPAALRAWLAERATTVLHLTPGLLEMLLAAGGPALPELRLILVGGAPLTCGLVRAARVVTSATLVNVYGSTETPQIVACHRVTDADLAGRPAGAPVPVGAGVAGHQVWVRTPAGGPAGIGQRGEVVITSRNLADGYVGSARDGFANGTEPGVRTFHTGDLGRIDPWGRLILDGRADRQVQLGGHRVELGEVEAAALRQPAVRHAVADLADSPLGPILTLWVDAEPSLTATALRAHLRSLLPAAAVPGAIRQVAGFELGPNHKLRPGAAPEPAARAGHDQPRPGGTAAWLLETLATAVGRPVGPDENFFDAGLNSITLLRLHGTLADRLDRRFPVTAVFGHPNVRSLAEYLDGAATPAPFAPPTSSRSNDHRLLRDEGQARRELRRRLRDQHQKAGE